MCGLYILNLIFCIIGYSFASEKYCVNCKYFVKNSFLFSKSTFGKCSAFRKNIDSNKIDYLISGKEKKEYNDVFVERMTGLKQVVIWILVSIFGIIILLFAISLINFSLKVI